MIKRTEEELGTCVVSALREGGWKVYQEVSLAWGSRTVDVVATRGPVLWAIELKLGNTMALLNQAMSLVGRVHRVSVATPLPATGAFRLCLEQMGAGHLRVRDGGRGFEQMDEDLVPALLRTAHKAPMFVGKRLCKEQSDGTYAGAGSAGGGHFTPFKRTCRRLLEHVKANPGCSLKEAVDNIEHHYRRSSTAMACLAQSLSMGETGIVPGVQLRRVMQGKRCARLELWPLEET